MTWRARFKKKLVAVIAVVACDSILADIVEAARQAGYDDGYDDGRLIARPVIIPFAAAGQTCVVPSPQAAQHR